MNPGDLLNNWDEFTTQIDPKIRKRKIPQDDLFKKRKAFFFPSILNLFS
jgi:hypothetical protein